ncbi:platelet-activating factor acetylhydrolase [Lasiosphaeria miniovina]|uniref:1-alkyl-2-acetylglycerophosphocholine esterase n=1 Tax=Lasiosphaeria miniovina TaxID=1954250 RepID=A0AA40ED41_9PEZI|nr:platelet-activating factor acetylhydrolase [Lasiosphaeria miniovina]KAK0733927.1 platelet-activating factor acetylhydrolase [Lasiosphaeria miniovina]
MHTKIELGLEPEPEPETKPARPPPAPRPRKTLRERFLHSLPPYTGPYPVGYMEVELPAREPRPFSHIKRNDEYALKLDTVLFSVFYPCELGLFPQENKSGNRTRRWTGNEQPRVLWLPKPRGSTCRGYAKFFSIPHLPVQTYIALTTMFTKLPAYHNANLSARWPTAAGGGSSKSTLDHDAAQKTGENDRNVKPKFSVIIFSHGLGGSRTLCSSVCGELASFGLIVVAMEHRDGSGARTYVNKTGRSPDLEDQDLDRTTAREPRTGKIKLPRRRQKTSEIKPNYMVDYLFPKDNAFDTYPHNDRGIDTELRAAQIEMRIAETEEAYYALGLINSGRGDQLDAQNLRKKGNVGSSSKGLAGIDWREWTGRLYLENVTMMGHSFGGATTIQALRLEKLTWISQGILLDPWGLGAPDSTDRSRIRKPILSVGSEAFMFWKENFDCVAQICREARDAGALSWMTTIRGSTHLSMTDFAVLYPKWMSLLIKTIVNPKRANHLTTRSALEFLKITLPLQQTRFRLPELWAEKRLLKIPSSETKVLFDHQPDDKWTAVRLKIPNEFSLRLRWYWRWRGKDADVPKDAAGKPLRGLLNWGAGKEMWVHLSPDQADVERYIEENG